MCGILAYFKLGGVNGDLAAFRAAMSAGAHRGPDDTGVAFFRVAESSIRHLLSERGIECGYRMESPCQLVLGHLRLSILDLSAAGHQPMMATNGTCWITYNGEIYNYLELREQLERAGVSFRSQSDTEVILEAYRAWGPQCVNRFVGMWSFVLVDVSERKLFCSRDRFGIKPFYYF